MLDKGFFFAWVKCFKIYNFGSRKAISYTLIVSPVVLFQILALHNFKIKISNLPIDLNFDNTIVCYAHLRCLH